MHAESKSGPTLKPKQLLLLLLTLQANISAADLATGLNAAARMDWATAFKEFKPLAEQGDSNARVNLGNLYMRGLGVTQSYQEALHWYQLAAQQGNRTGQGKVALIHYHGLGVEPNHAEAIKWFTQAANQGDPESAIILGTLYASGDGVPPNRVQAYLWYGVAADLGKKQAMDERVSLAGEMTPGEISEAMAQLESWRMLHEPPLKDPGALPESKTPPSSAKPSPAKRPPHSKQAPLDKTVPQLH